MIEKMEAEDDAAFSLHLMIAPLDVYVRLGLFVANVVSLMYAMAVLDT